MKTTSNKIYYQGDGDFILYYSNPDLCQKIKNNYLFALSFIFFTVKEGVFMKAVVFNDVGDIRVKDVSEPKIKDDFDAIIKITSSAICGTDLHMIRGSLGPMAPGTILGHEAVGMVESVGKKVKNLKEGDRVVISATIACGYCSYCRAGYYAQCDNSNPNGKLAGTAFFGGPKDSGPFHGMQAEKVRVPFANIGCVKLPEDVTDDEAILLSDIFPTAYFGAENAEITHGDVVAVFGCGPVGQLAIISAYLLGAGRVIAVDMVPSRLELAQDLGAEIINFEKEHPIKTILELTGGIGVDRVIDAVGVDAISPKDGPAAAEVKARKKEFKEEVNKVAPEQHPHNGNWKPGDAPSLVLQWAVETVAKAGTVSVVGVYPLTARTFPIGMAMNKNLTLKMGNCNHRKYIPYLLDLIQSGTVNPEKIITQTEKVKDAVEAYKMFDERKAGWIKVELSANGS
jgi:threonine dehydrogenase-like Zn-dependent dehydrogenase